MKQSTLFVMLLIQLITGNAFAQEESLTIHRMPEQDLKDRLNALNSILAKNELDSSSSKALDKLRERAEVVASINFECNSVSINDMPNQRCKEFYLKELPDFDEEYLRATGKIYLNRALVAKGMADRRSQINSCVQEMEAFLNPDFDPQRLASLKISKIAIDPIDDRKINAQWTVDKSLNIELLSTLYERMKFWRERCLGILLSGSDSNQSVRIQPNDKWNPYFESQAASHFHNSPFYVSGDYVWYQQGWEHHLFVNGKELYTALNPTNDQPHLNLRTGRLAWQWRGKTSGNATFADTALTAVTENKLIRPSSTFGQIVDARDNQTYLWAQIGTQKWMRQNLNYKPKFFSGNSWCYLDSASNCQAYGRLYDWETARDICPHGWHLPSKKDWTQLNNYLGAGNIGIILASKSGWSDQQKTRSDGILFGGNGVDAVGFSALPSGIRDASNGQFLGYSGLGNYATFWSASECGGSGWGPGCVSDEHAWSYAVSPGSKLDSSAIYEKGSGQSVRCVAD